MKLSRFCFLLIPVVVFNGCANRPNPEEICSAQWIKPRIDSAIGEFRDDLEDVMGAVQKSGPDLSKGGTIGILEGATVLLRLSELVSNLQDSDTLNDLNLLGETCNDSRLALHAFTDVMKEYDVPQPFIDLLDELEAFRAFSENREAENS